MVKALVLMSGGLDSILAAKILQEQGIEVIGINFNSPFFGNKNALKAAEQLKIELHSIKLGKSYLKMLQKPKHGYGSAMNPCIDCHAFMLKETKKLLKKFNADFIATGEVLGERPMSQNKKSLDIVEKESGLRGKLLRPLSAKLLLETEAEKNKLVNREKLLDIQGRQRIIQMGLAKKYNLAYPAPGGGCLLCEEEFGKKLKDLFKNNESNEFNIELLKTGRHFRFKGHKIIIGRNQNENAILAKAKGIKLELTDDLPGPTGLIFSEDKEIVEKAAQLVNFYAHTNTKVVYGKAKFNKSILVKPIEQTEVESLRV